jgi:hypothetical protein
MIIFGLLTIRNVRHTQNRVRTVTGVVLSLENNNAPTTRNGQALGRKRDRHLLTMLLVQVTLLFLFTCPHAIEKVYSSFASSPPSPSLQDSIENLLFNVFTLLAFIASGMPFYIYTLTGGSLFRKGLIDLVKTIIRKFLCH